MEVFLLLVAYKILGFVFVIGLLRLRSVALVGRWRYAKFFSKGVAKNSLCR
jgi:hypothetical protein